ncbi:MAG: HAMP domain-containing protein [Rhodospirillales bacterium]|nr:MAG: HAMP domain-containing protein [Rhodospirillales bacterium]
MIGSWRRLPLGIRLSLACVAAEVILISLLTLGAVRILDNNLTARALVRINDMRSLMAISLADPLIRKDYGQLSDTLHSFRQRGDIPYALLTDLSGHVLFIEGKEVDAEPFVPDTNILEAAAKTPPHFHAETEIELDGQSYGTLRFTLSLSFLVEARNQLLTTLTLIGSLVAALSIAVFFAIGLMLAKPIKALTVGAEALAAGDMNVMLPITNGGDEVGRLTAAFARMAAALSFRISELQDNQTRLNRTVEELVRSNSELERFAFVASHDLREPIRSVVSFSQLLERKLKDKNVDPDISEYLRFLVDAGKRMNELVTDLLDFSRIDADEEPFVSVSLDKSLASAKENLADAIEKSKATVRAEGPLPDVRGNPIQLIELLQNLIGNSIKFCRRDEAPLIKLSARRQDQEWVISVADNGIGIEPEFRSKAFDIFRRYHRADLYPGTGMGLAICKRIVERHKGNIWIDSMPGKGSVFTFTLPAAN